MNSKKGENDYGNSHPFFPHLQEKKHTFLPTMNENVGDRKAFWELPFSGHMKGITGIGEGRPFEEPYS